MKVMLTLLIIVCTFVAVHVLLPPSWYRGFAQFVLGAMFGYISATAEQNRGHRGR